MLGRAYLQIAAVRNLDTAEHWYRRSLDQCPSSDSLRRGKALGQIGQVAHERFEQARSAGRPDAELLVHLRAAAEYYHRSLDLLPSTAVEDLSVAHNQLGVLYTDAGMIDHALNHYRHSIRHAEASGDLHLAGGTRHNVATMLFNVGRLSDARDYAEAAVINFRDFGERAADWRREAEDLLANIDTQIESGGQH
jgi:tetratricopeptide (TPR) repeat protein